MKYYRVDFKLKPGVKDADEEVFIPVMVCVLQELYEILDIYFNHNEICIADIVNIRPATEDEVMNYTHYYI